MAWLDRLSDDSDSNHPCHVMALSGIAGNTAARPRLCLVGALDEGNPEQDPDRWCWPNSEAMNGPEISAYAQRLALFTDRGLSLANAEWEAYKLTRRDREGGDWVICLECRHLNRGRCAQWRQAGISSSEHGALLPRALVTQAQRCYCFGDAQ